MYLTLFALLSVIGAWAAWRSHPLYSARATIQFVAIVGLAVAAYIAAILGVVNLTETARRRLPYARCSAWCCSER